MPEKQDQGTHWRWIEHRGKRILELDLRGCSGEEATARQREFADLIQAQPKRSVLCLTFARGVRYDPRHMREFAEHMRANEPYVRLSAIVGLEHLTKLLAVLNRMSGRKVQAFDDADEAKEWLIGQLTSDD